MGRAFRHEYFRTFQWLVCHGDANHNRSGWQHFVADFYNNRVQKFSPDGVFLSTFGTQGSGAGQFEKAIAVTVARDGSVFVADFANNRIQKWKPAGNASLP